ncbi:MAG TPA: hypothetical protein DIW24_02015 [Bacteroidetes bacterium]|nr:hypothetical protein [Bacteroidota bacterium]
MFALEYTITLIEPVLVTTLDGDPNDAVTLPYLPGSAIRGTWVKAFCKQNKIAQLDAHNADHRALFLDGKVCFLNAYPQLGNLVERALPTPLSVRYKKHEKQSVRDLAFDDSDDGKQWKSADTPFCKFDGSSIINVGDRRILNIHTQRNRKSGRAQKDDGAVFRYDALRQEQSFRGIIISEDQSLLLKITSCKPVNAWIGGAQSAGYGKVTFEVGEINESWTETGSDEDVDPQRVVVTCLSDVILRDQLGAYSPNADVLREHMGIAKEKLQVVFAKSTIVGGFNRKWGLPLPQAPAIKMGSVLVFENLSEKEVEQLELCTQNGIGERKAEGFGRITLNWHGALALNTSRENDTSNPPTRKGVAQEDKAVAQMLLERMWWQKAEQRIEATANELREKGKGTIPPKSQLGQFRSVLRNGMGKPSIIEDFIQHTQSKKDALKKFSRFRLNGKTLFELYNEPPSIVDIKATIGSADVYNPSPLDRHKFKTKLLLEIVVQLSKKEQTA